MGNKHSLNILHFMSAFPVSDRDPTSVYLKHLVESLSDRLNVAVLAPGTPDKQELPAEDYKIHRFAYFKKEHQNFAHGDGILQNIRIKPIRILLAFPYVISAFFSLITLVRRHRYNIIHAHWILPQGFLAVMAKMLCLNHLKVIVTSHGSDIYELKGTLFEPVLKFTLARSDIVNVVSSPMIREVREIYPHDEIHVIPMGTRKKLFLHPDPVREDGEIFRRRYLLFVGRLNPKKGVQYLIDALAILRDRHPDLHAYLIGSGYYRATLEDKIAAHQLTDRVHFFGKIPQEELIPFYKNAEVLVGPSYESEGFGLVFVEAMLLRCPVIGADSGGIRDVIRDGVTGLLVRPTDAGDLAEKIDYLLKNRENREDLIQRAYAFALDNYTTEKVSEKFFNLYHSLGYS